ncbi:MAG: rhamnogalacturonan acetylesterase [Prevotella sp.]|nr:rhamnogalacturonan acetylesterase [Candidatus Equicola faecalis]MDO4818958.1 rhamnogalacturonan acetylesterase [Prevotella sp.]
MKKTFLISLGVLCATALLFCSLRERPVTIFMIGDSTMANKPVEGKDADNQERGWGQMLQQYLDSTKIIVDNHAVNGRSSKSFIDEGRWKRVLDHIRPGDYVIIQFGHNDEKPKADRHTDPGSTFDDNLMRFIRETRESGATPILMNSIVRRKWSGDVDGHLIDTHGEYAVAPRNVARQTGCIFVDATQITHDYIEALGPERSKELFCWLPIGKYKTAPNGRQDDTHLNIHGGTVIAGLLISEVASQDKTIRKALTKKGKDKQRRK